MTQKTPMEQKIQEFLEHLEIEKGRSARTIRNYKFYLERFNEWAKISDPRQIDLEMVRNYRLHLNRDFEGRDEASLKKTTQNYHLIALRSFLKYLAKRDINTLSAEKIELAKHDARHIEFLTIEELTRLREAPKKKLGIIRKRDSAIIEMLFCTGLRVSELANLYIEQVNLRSKEFTVAGKGSKYRIVFISPFARDALRDYLSMRKDSSPYLFVSHDRAKEAREPQPISPRSVQRIIDKYAREAGITKKITPHVLRHTFATDLLRNGADIRAVQALLGHESITTTQVYTHVTDKHLREVHEEFHGKPRS